MWIDLFIMEKSQYNSFSMQLSQRFIVLLFYCLFLLFTVCKEIKDPLIHCDLDFQKAS